MYTICRLRATVVIGTAKNAVVAIIHSVSSAAMNLNIPLSGSPDPELISAEYPPITHAERLEFLN